MIENCAEPDQGSGKVGEMGIGAKDCRIAYSSFLFQFISVLVTELKILHVGDVELIYIF